MSRVRVGLLGLGFGAEFIPIYQAHPHAELVAVAQRSEKGLDAIADHFEIERRYTSLELMLQDPEIDAIHINTPIGCHADHAVAALNAGKHVACTVPMATTIDDIKRVVAAQEASGKSYMMMETAVYTREFLYAKELVNDRSFGRIQFLRGAHMQEMAGWPDYWRALPPMHYATHAVSPLLALAGKDAKAVRALGSGRVTSNDPLLPPTFAVETALFQLWDSDVAAEVTRSLFDVAREYVESFNVYGEKKSFEWQQLEVDGPVVFLGEAGNRIAVPDYAHLLPPEIRRFTTEGVYDADKHQHLSFTQGSGHGGSHPHMAHEFVMSILEGRPPFPDVYTSANWTSAGVAAHESATTGREIQLPVFASIPRQRSDVRLRAETEDRRISIYREGSDSPVIVQNAPADRRAYIHPIAVPGGTVPVTEDAPDHHPWQHGLYVGYNDVNGVGFWHEGLRADLEDDGTFHPRILRAAEVTRDRAEWAVESEYRTKDGDPLLRETQAWTFTDRGDHYVLDLELTLHALTDLTFGRYDYGGLFIRMPFRKEVGGRAYNSEGFEGADAEASRARWVATQMPIAGLADEVTVVITDHPANREYPTPWRVDPELGVVPSVCIAGAWSLAGGSDEVFRHRVLVYPAPVTSTTIDSAAETYSGRLVR